MRCRRCSASSSYLPAFTLYVAISPSFCSALRSSVSAAFSYAVGIRILRNDCAIGAASSSNSGLVSCWVPCSSPCITMKGPSSPGWRSGCVRAHHRPDSARGAAFAGIPHHLILERAWHWLTPGRARRNFLSLGVPFAQDCDMSARLICRLAFFAFASLSFSRRSDDSGVTRAPFQRADGVRFLHRRSARSPAQCT